MPNLEQPSRRCIPFPPPLNFSLSAACTHSIGNTDFCRRIHNGIMLKLPNNIFIGKKELLIMGNETRSTVSDVIQLFQLSDDPSLKPALEISKATSAECKSVWKQHASLPDTAGNLPSPSKYFSIFQDPPGARQGALKLCKSISRILWDLTDRIVTFWSSCDLGAALWESSRGAGTAAQHSGRLGAVFS